MLCLIVESERIFKDNATIAHTVVKLGIGSELLYGSMAPSVFSTDSCKASESSA